MNNTPKAQALSFDHGMELRYIVIDGAPWLSHADACRILDIRNSWQALQPIPDSDKLRQGIGSLGRKPWLLNLNGLHALIKAASRKPRAAEFGQWASTAIAQAINDAEKARAEEERRRIRAEEDAILAKAIPILRQRLSRVSDHLGTLAVELPRRLS